MKTTVMLNNIFSNLYLHTVYLHTHAQQLCTMMLNCEVLCSSGG